MEKSAKAVVAKCEICPRFVVDQVNFKNNLKGWCQIYQHYTTTTHQNAIKECEKDEHSIPISLSSLNFEVSKAKQTTLDSLFKTKPVAKCQNIFEEEIVNAFKNDSVICRVTAKYIFNNEKPYNECQHKACYKFCNWIKCHKDLHNQYLKKAAQMSFASFVPGDLENPPRIRANNCTGIPVNGKCLACKKVYRSLKNTLSKRASKKLDGNRVGKPGMRWGYLKPTEKEEALKDQILKEKEYKKELLSRSQKTWEDRLEFAINNGLSEKLIVDLLTLYNEPYTEGEKPVQIIVLENLIMKLHSKSNHHYDDLIKDIGVIFRSYLGPVNYTLLSNIFGLPSVTTARVHASTSKIELGFNDDKSLENIYGNSPVSDCSDEARALRMLSPKLLENGDIELIGMCFDPDINKWETSRVVLERGGDEYSKLYHLVKANENNLSKSFGVHNL